MFRRIGIVAKSHDPGVRDALASVLRVLGERGCDIYVESDAAALVAAGGFTAVPAPQLPDSCDLVISIGGDGTLLHSAGMIYPREVALLGINLGRLGFLTDLPPAAIESGLDAVLDGECRLEERAVLGCEVWRQGNVVASEDALNDVVVQKWNTARLITLDTYVDETFVHSQRADGMIVATPTGSTAYALSGGGPILDPSIAALALVPICPHTLTNRPIVVSDRAQIEIRVTTEREDGSRVTCDGNAVHELLPDDRVRVFRRSRAVRLVHPLDHDHFATLRAKLNWGSHPC
ncbi:MAG: NAD(+) kinase [Gammaproteobacteria bacterium]